MGCGCGSKKTAKQFVYKDENGHEKIFNTLIEARAAQLRGDKKGSIREVEKADAK